MATSSLADLPASGVLTQKTSRKSVPESVQDLLGVAIFTFACQSGLRSYHKVRGGPVIEGVSAFFGSLIKCSSTKTQADYEGISLSRFGGWKPGDAPSKELSGMISSRLKTLKSKGAIGEHSNTEVPCLLQEKKKLVSDDDRVHTRVFPRCWRCGTRCEFCRNKRKFFPQFGDFRVDMAAPFLEVIDDMAENKEFNKSDDESNSQDCSDNVVNADLLYDKLTRPDFDFSDEMEASDSNYGESTNKKIDIEDNDDEDHDNTDDSNNNDELLEETGISD